MLDCLAGTTTVTLLKYLTLEVTAVSFSVSSLKTEETYVLITLLLNEHLSKIDVIEIEAAVYFPNV